MIQQGELLAGKYRVEQVLGAGGMGYVVAALHEQLGQRVAVKLLAPELCEDPDSVTRFLREARAAVRIHSEHVARVLDVGELANGEPYMVMEFLSGHDLAEELEAPGQLEVAVAIDYLLQASEAVAEAHSLNLIHRDIKPANLFLTHRRDGSPLIKVLDFGISKAINVDENGLDQAPSLTATHSFLGSPAYMSPEQIRRPKSVDTRTDIWALGSTLYHLLVGEPPFNAESPIALLAAVVSDPMPSVCERRPDVPRELEAVIAKCLEKKPEHRYQTVAELADALVPFAPRSQPSVSRISGILRATSLSPVIADVSPSSQRTLQSNGALSTGDDKTEDLRVKVVTPAPGAGSDKSTKSDWEATPQRTLGSRRRALAALVVASGASVAALFLWRSRAPLRAEAAPEPTAVKVSGGAPQATLPTAAEAATVAPAPAAPPAVSPSASAAAAPESSSGVAATKAKHNEKLHAVSRPAPAAVVTNPAAPAEAAPSPKPPVADPLDGRR